VATNERAPDEAARIVEVGAKDVTERVAVAEARLRTTPDAVARLQEGTRKGHPLEAARIAGIMGVKRTPDLLPFCHPIAVTGAEVLVEPDPAGGTVRVQATVKARDRTGVEMEALTACAIAALTIYDMCKSIDRSMTIGELALWEKTGGRSGTYRRPGGGLDADLDR
jgi:cyclic pyranopterin phosphate synthase